MTSSAKRVGACALALVVCLLLVGTTQAGVGEPMTSAWIDSPPTTALIRPDGLGSTLADQGATVYVEVLDLNGTPLVNIPAQDIWLANWGEGNFLPCLNGSIADHPTDGMGQTTISRVSGGGFSPDFTQVLITGAPTTMTGPLPLRIVSADLTGNHVVDLADVGAFAAGFFGPYQFQADLTGDGVVNLADLGAFATAIGSFCP